VGEFIEERVGPLLEDRILIGSGRRLLTFFHLLHHTAAADAPSVIDRGWESYYTLIHIYANLNSARNAAWWYTTKLKGPRAVQSAGWCWVAVQRT
jgi:hypothetical protein